MKSYFQIAKVSKCVKYEWEGVTDPWEEQNVHDEHDETF